ncbi:NLR family CARD domain-containing protein 3-like [Anguilla anguilla]|uniref:NLR family CARD domain-containing protein 3-like n=1 Tax=Anguilla anguilla TaxID=7936 RepID=UPI0015AC8AF7|nr:NLR family CARD domain-containing protein 3-like [Anguilla anguilla]
MKQKDLAESLERDVQHNKLIKRAQQALKIDQKKKFECIFEGFVKQGPPTLLNELYTELYITEGGSGAVNTEHEIRHIEAASKRQTTQETAIPCNDIFKPLPGQDKPIRTVLTKGIAGIGKTISVQKFILDWAEGKANQDIDFIFSLPFRDLNLKKEREFSLMQLLQHYFPQLKEIKNIDDEVKIVFIFDGLDECRLALDFQSNEICCDITESSSVDVLLTNLIKGNLLPSALLWITSRPATANQIPPECIHQVTEVRGFKDPQKEEYFRKRIRDHNQASTILSHIKSSRSLYIMFHIPVFCRISATVLETMLGETKSGDLPNSLTEMYTHFLLIQTNMNNQKYLGTNRKKMSVSDTEIILKLGQLAFLQLKKGNLIFYEEDLRESGIDVNEASVYSGVCTEIFKEECGLDQQKVYCFVHLSIQEYLAALFVFHSLVSENRNVLSADESKPYSDRVQLSELHKSAVDQALESKNGHLDLFLRFLLGLSLDSTRTLLGGLLTQTGSSSPTRSRSESIEKTVQYIKMKIREESSAERTINLFHCLNELNDNSLVEEIQNSLRSGTLSDKELEPHQCSALAFVLLMSEGILDEFDLKTYNISAAGHQRLLPVVRNCRKRKKECKVSLELGWCNLTEVCCDVLASVLRSPHSELIDLELRDNELQDSGVRALSAGLEDPHCKLQRLGMSSCGVTQTGCDYLASALCSNPSHLRELDLSYNHPGDSGVRALSAAKLDTLTLLVDHGGENRTKPGPRKYGCQLTLDPNTANRELSLSEGNRKVTHTLGREESYPDHPERFEYWPQVVCRESVCERCYWEAEYSMSDEGMVYVAVTYKGEDSDCLFGGNKNSWSLRHVKHIYSVSHNAINTHIPASPYRRAGVCGDNGAGKGVYVYRVGVCVDRPAGTLSFYSISDTNTLTLLHTFHTHFTEHTPLCAGFGVYNSSVSLCQLE